MKNHLNKTIFEIVDQGVSFRKEADQVADKGFVKTKVKGPQLRVVASAQEGDKDVAEFKERLAKVRANSAKKAQKSKPKKAKNKGARKPLTESEKRAKRDKEARKPLKSKLSLDLSKVKVAA